MEEKNNKYKIICMVLSALLLISIIGGGYLYYLYSKKDDNKTNNEVVNKENIVIDNENNPNKKYDLAVEKIAIKENNLSVTKALYYNNKEYIIRINKNPPYDDVNIGYTLRINDKVLMGNMLWGEFEYIQADNYILINMVWGGTNTGDGVIYIYDLDGNLINDYSWFEEEKYGRASMSPSTISVKENKVYIKASTEYHGPSFFVKESSHRVEICDIYDYLTDDSFVKVTYEIEYNGSEFTKLKFYKGVTLKEFIDERNKNDNSINAMCHW